MVLIASHHSQVSVKVIFVQNLKKYLLKMLNVVVQNDKCISSQLKEMASKINGVDFITPQSGLGKSYICPNVSKVFPKNANHICSKC